MDLPTCPSCGQSVLDDDAAICPFCGAAMDGSAAGKQTAAPAASKGKPTKPADSGDDDPFAVERAPAAARVIPCARKPMKGRMHRVICPMCDCQGFIPKGAIGRQVKCANKECLVPVFTAEGDGGDTPTRAPGRVSDDAVAREVKVSTEGGKKNPMVIYGIVGVVALAATVGLVKYLNSMGTNELPPLPTVPGAGANVAGTDTPDEAEPVTPVKDPDEPVAEPVPEYRKKALELLVDMIDTSRVTSGNRDKAYCRRMTADAYLRLGMMEEAAEQFEALDRLSTDRRSRKGYYKMVPLLNRYWRLIAAGENDKAASVLETASSLRTQMPSSGDVALESGIMLAAAVAHNGDMKLAAEIVKYQGVDRTVISQIDTLKLAAWSTTAMTMDELGRPIPSPFGPYTWYRPLVTAITSQLAARGHWDAAITWAGTAPELRSVGDCYSVIAAEMSVQNDLSAASALVTAATEKGAETLLRVNSTLGGTSASHWNAAKAAVDGMQPAERVQINGFQAYIDAPAPDLSISLVQASALADYVAAAAQNGDDQAAASAMKLLFAVACSQIPPTIDVRKTAYDVSEDDAAVKRSMVDELRLKESEVRTQFIAYRQGVDRIQRASELRHRTLLGLLVRVIDRGGLDVVKAAYENDGDWTQELAIDNLRAVLFSAAAAEGAEWSDILQPKRGMDLQLFRADPADEIAIIGIQLSAWRGYLAGQFTPARALESASRLQGLCTACLRFIAQQLAAQADAPDELVDEILLIKNGVYREQCLGAVCRTATLNGQMSKAIGSVNKYVKAPTQKVVATHGIVLGALTLEAAAEDGK
ncbi:MAG: hypothetical protein NXI04_11725 [Planctomycetaceae bacterium]|nr:hypothetical protein [Planctomycetaceae bacterium]